MSLRLTHATCLILRAITTGWRHGFEIMEVSGLASGTVHPALRWLERTASRRAIKRFTGSSPAASTEWSRLLDPSSSAIERADRV